MNFLLRKNISLVVSDMAGTILNERGIIYDALYNTLQTLEYTVNKDDKKLWYGKDKNEVLQQYIHPDQSEYAEFLLLSQLENEYFTNSKIKLIDNVLDTFQELRENNIKIALNTGYPKQFQNKIIDFFNLNEYIDNSISSQQVLSGRPDPYMIHRLMEKTSTNNVNHVAKIGDTINDMLEGKNAGCGLTIGVLSGAENRDELSRFADLIVNDITEITKID